MNRVEVIEPVRGIYAMRVCAVKDATDDEVLEVANRLNPSGTMNGWGRVYRTDERDHGGFDGPVQCREDYNRVHLILSC